MSLVLDHLPEVVAVLLFAIGFMPVSYTHLTLPTTMTV